MDQTRVLMVVTFLIGLSLSLTGWCTLNRSHPQQKILWEMWELWDYTLSVFMSLFSMMCFSLFKRLLVVCSKRFFYEDLATLIVFIPCGWYIFFVAFEITKWSRCHVFDRSDVPYWPTCVNSKYPDETSPDTAFLLSFVGAIFQGIFCFLRQAYLHDIVNDELKKIAAIECENKEKKD